MPGPGPSVVFVVAIWALSLRFCGMAIRARVRRGADRCQRRHAWFTQRQHFEQQRQALTPNVIDHPRHHCEHGHQQQRQALSPDVITPHSSAAAGDLHTTLNNFTNVYVYIASVSKLSLVPARGAVAPRRANRRCGRRRSLAGPLSTIVYAHRGAK